MWYKKEGGTVIKSLEADKIETICIIHTPRALSFLKTSKELHITSEITLNPDAVTVVASEENNDSPANYIVFQIVQSDGKELILRGTKVDRVIKWINIISTVTELHTWEYICTYE